MRIGKLFAREPIRGIKVAAIAQPAAVQLPFNPVRALGIVVLVALRDRWLTSACRGRTRAGLALTGLIPGPPNCGVPYGRSGRRRGPGIWRSC